MKASKTENQFQTNFQQSKSSSQKNSINIPNHNYILIISQYWSTGWQ